MGKGSHGSGSDDDKAEPSPPKSKSTDAIHVKKPSASLLHLHLHKESRMLDVHPQHLNEDSDTLEAVLEYVGEFGCYQKILFISMLPFGVGFAFVYVVQMLVAATPSNYWCKVPELAHISDPLMRRKLSTPRRGQKYDGCRIYVTNWSKVLKRMKPPHRGTPTRSCPYGWEFLFDDIPYSTIVTERQWVCKKAKNVVMAQTVFFLGASFGGLLTGWLADRHGRIPALVLSNLFGLIGGVLTIFTVGFWDFAISRFIAGMSYDNCFIMMYILVMEYVGPKHRTFVANMSVALFFGTAAAVVPWLAYWIKNWRTLLWVTSAPMLMALAAPLFVPESCRWLVSRGHTERALRILRKFERVNGTIIPNNVLEEFIDSAKHTKHDENLITLFKSPVLRLVMILTVCVTGIVTLVYDALFRMSENVGVDFFISLTFNAVVEIPANAATALLLDRFGRRKFTYLPMCMAGCLALIAGCVPEGIAMVILVVSARFMVILCDGATTQWATEMLPTAVRASGSSLVHIAGYVASLLSPPIVFTHRAWRPLPMLIVAALSVVSASISVFLPETKGRPMPQSILEGEHLVRQNSILFNRSQLQNQAVPKDLTDEKTKEEDSSSLKKEP